MNVLVPVAGHRRAWRLLESSSLIRWIEDEPWFSSTPPMVVQVASTQRAVFRAELSGLLRRFTSPDDEPRRDWIDEAQCQQGPRTGLRTWMGVESDHPRHLAETLARLGENRPRLLVLELPPDDAATTWLDDLSRILDLHAKLPRPGMIAVLALLTGMRPAAGAVRLHLAWPVEATQVNDDDDRWAAYLHERVAWFSGGNLEVATRIGDELPALGKGADLVLERAMDRHAKDLFAGIDEDLQKRLLDDITPVRNHSALRLTVGLSGPEARSLRPAPWLARALLLARPNHPQRRFLDAMSGCRPLASRLLGRCMDLEQRVRDRVAASTPGGPPGDSAKTRMSRIEHDPDAIEHQLTPLGHLGDLDPWQFASLAEIIKAAPIDRRTRKAMHRLRLIRNALAHGTPVGWGAITTLDSLEAALA